MLCQLMGEKGGRRGDLGEEKALTHLLPRSTEELHVFFVTVSRSKAFRGSLWTCAPPLGFIKPPRGPEHCSVPLWRAQIEPRVAQCESGWSADENSEDKQASPV